MNLEEEWRPVVGYEGLYEVSNLGRVKRVIGSIKYRSDYRILKPGLDSAGYLIVGLCKEGKSRSSSVHRLVAKAFIPNPENKPQVNHGNCIKTDNTVVNLSWATAKENIQHARVNGLIKRPKVKRLFQNIKVINCRGEVFDSIGEASFKYGANRCSISRVCNGKSKMVSAGKYEDGTPIKWEYKKDIL